MIKVGAGNSVHRKGPCSPRRRPSRGHFLFRPLLRVHFPIPRLPIVTKPGGPPLDDRFSTLRNYRRARGLCVRCGEKWAPGHKCPPVPQLHVLQEIWDVCQAEFEAPDSPEDSPEPVPPQLFLMLSSAAVSGSQAPLTLRLSGTIAGQHISILVDSGSSHSFLSFDIAAKLDGVQPLSVPLSVRVADGGSVQCVSQIPDAEWVVQGHRFHSTLHILALGSYDMIVGMDWLEAFSPMKVDWKGKWLSIPYGRRQVLLQGELSDGSQQGLCQLLHISATSTPDMSTAHPPEIEHLLQEFSSLFEVPSGLPPRRSCDHHIPLIPGAPPVAVRQYRYKPALKNEIEQQVSEMLQSGLVRPSTSAYSSPVLLVKKKDDTWRMCVDYRMLNALTVKAKFPIPVVDELLDELSSAKWFSCLDLRSGFNQIQLAPGEEHKTAFQTHWGQFEYTVMSFGLTGAPNTFQGAMNSTLLPVLRKCALVFFDDILVYSASYDEHLTHLRQVFELLAADQWKLKLSKCRFAQQSISYLGHVISSQGVATDPSKIESVLHWPLPQDVKQLRSFLGLAGYYRKFVKNYAVLARPLTDLLKKSSFFVWTPAHTASFEALKSALVAAPVLALPDFNKSFQLQTDASEHGVGAVLLQEGHPIAFVSKSLGPKTRGLSTYEKEYLAILVAVDQWRAYLQHGEFTIFSDQKSLVHLTDQHLHTPWQMKMYSKLIGLQYKIVYRPGASNAAADALSRHPHPPAQVNAISSVSPIWLSEVITGYSADPKTVQLLQELAVNPQSHPPFSLSSGLLRYNGRVWIGDNKALQSKIIAALHNSALGGHSGFPVTHSRVKKLFAWRGLKSDVKLFVASCSICLQAKPDRAKYPGLLSPLPVPSEAW